MLVRIEVTNDATDGNDDSEATAQTVHVLPYEPPMCDCLECGTPTSRILCLPCATRLSWGVQVHRSAGGAP